MSNILKNHIITNLFMIRNSWMANKVHMAELITVDSYFVDMIESVWFSELSEKEFEELQMAIKKMNEILIQGGDVSKFIDKISYPGQ